MRQNTAFKQTQVLTQADLAKKGHGSALRRATRSGVS
jgi:hypothetical protein